MTNLSDLFPAGAGKQVSFVASGTLSNGQAVGLTSDGKVKAMSAQTGSAVVFEADTTYLTATAYDSANNRIVIVFTESVSGYDGYAIVGTVSGSSISFGTAVAFNGTSATDSFSIVFDSSNNKVVIAFRDNPASNIGKAVVGTVSGTSISFGAVATFENANSAYIGATFDSNSNKVVIAYTDYGNSSYGTAIVGTVSGTSISFGSAVVFESANTTNIGVTFDSNSNKAVIGYRDNGNSGYGTGIVGTVSGTSISFGTAAVYSGTSATSDQAITFDSSSNKVIAVYLDGGNNSYGTAVVGTVSGTSISFGTPVVYEASDSYYNSATFDSNLNKVIVAYKQSSPNEGNVIVGTVSGTSISFETSVTFNAANTAYISVAFDTTSNKAVIAYRNSGGSNVGEALTFDASGFPTSNFIGITDAAISDTASGNVTIKGGISTSVTGLTPASDYYVQDDGTISTVSSSVKAGKALSATAINLEYTS